MGDIHDILFESVTNLAVASWLCISHGSSKTTLFFIKSGLGEIQFAGNCIMVKIFLPTTLTNTKNNGQQTVLKLKDPRCAHELFLCRLNDVLHTE